MTFKFCCWPYGTIQNQSWPWNMAKNSQPAPPPPKKRKPEINSNAYFLPPPRLIKGAGAVLLQPTLSTFKKRVHFPVNKSQLPRTNFPVTCRICHGLYMGRGPAKKHPLYNPPPPPVICLHAPKRIVLIWCAPISAPCTPHRVNIDARKKKRGHVFDSWSMHGRVDSRWVSRTRALTNWNKDVRMSVVSPRSWARINTRNYPHPVNNDGNDGRNESIHGRHVAGRRVFFLALCTESVKGNRVLFFLNVYY